MKGNDFSYTERDVILYALGSKVLFLFFGGFVHTAKLPVKVMQLEIGPIYIDKLSSTLYTDGKHYQYCPVSRARFAKAFKRQNNAQNGMEVLVKGAPKPESHCSKCLGCKLALESYEMYWIKG
jgi:hypothetical protein